MTAPTASSRSLMHVKVCIYFWRLFSNYYYWKWVNNDILACNCYWSQTSVSVKKKETSRPWQDLFVLMKTRMATARRATTRCRREIIQEKKKILWMWDIQVMLHPQVFFNVIGPKEICKIISGLSEDDKLVSLEKSSEEWSVDDSPEVWNLWKYIQVDRFRCANREKKQMNTLWLETGSFITKRHIRK